MSIAAWLTAKYIAMILELNPFGLEWVINMPPGLNHWVYYLLQGHIDLDNYFWGAVLGTIPPKPIRRLHRRGITYHFVCSVSFYPSL